MEEKNHLEICPVFEKILIKLLKEKNQIVFQFLMKQIIPI